MTTEKGSERASAVARANIALVKYWGQRDAKRVLPFNSSISMTLDKLRTHTTVEFGGRKDAVELNGKQLDTRAATRILMHVDVLRRMARAKDRVRVRSDNNFPTGAGLASSASGFAALTVAVDQALGLGLSERRLSQVARLGSGSASRSIFGGYAEFRRGERGDGSDCFARQLFPGRHWKLAMVVNVLSRAEKAVSSAAGMQQTVKTSPLYRAWLETVEGDLGKVKRALGDRNFALLGETAENNCVKMHAAMMTTRPPLLYWGPATIALMKEVVGWRADGLNAFYTIDAGPQVKVLCLPKDVPRVRNRLRALNEVKESIVCFPGPGARVTDKHLF